MGSGGSDHHQEQQQQQQYRMISGYEASAASSSHDPGALRQQHFAEGGFFPWASLRSASAQLAPHAPPQAIPAYFRQQEQLLRSSIRDEAPPASLMEMALNVRGMNVIPLAQRPSSSTLVLEEQAAPHHQLQQYMHQQQQHLLQRSASVPVAAVMSPRAAPPGAPGTILQHIHHQAEQQAQIQQLQQHQHQMQLVTSSSSTGASGGSTCKECGNQAKKDCPYQRCRTCCKSRGFECATHVRSTWVPAAKRRERQMAEAAAVASGQPRPKSKRNRAIAMQQQQEQLGAPGDSELQLHHHHHHHHHHQLQNPGAPSQLMAGALEEDLQGTTTTTTSNSPHSDARQSQSDMGGLPSEVRAQAVFKCVKVTRVDNGEDEFAYQAVVRIGGRVFKGVLQDHGSDAGTSISGETTSLGELQLAGVGAAPSAGGAAGIGGGGATGGETPPPQLLQLDPAPGSAGGMFGSSDPKELFRES